MALVFYRQVSSRVLVLGTGECDPWPDGRLVSYEGDVLLTKDGIKRNGRLIKDFTLFTGEPATLIVERIPMQTIRAWKRTRDKIPPTYIDGDCNVIEGATGRIIFNAHA